MKEDKHGSVSAMSQFNRDHWEKKLDGTNVAGGRYASEMNTAAEYNESVGKLAAYAKKNRAQHQTDLPCVKAVWGSCKKRALFLNVKRIYKDLQ